MPSTARISVALCTFNGGAFLRAQLDSLLAQTRAPAELVVRDDGSTDDTLDVLGQFTAPFPVHVHRNVERLGPAQNFAAAIAACTGDLIACCDQDDVWLPHKLATLGEPFDRRPDLGFAFSDAEAVDAAGRPLGYRLWDSVGFTPRRRRQFADDSFPVLVRQNVVTGATLMFAARLRPLVLPVPAGWMHDGWIALLAAATDAGGVAVPEPLVRYRQHASQAVGAERLSLGRQIRTARQMSRTVFDEQATAYELVLRRLADWHMIAGPQDHIAIRSFGMFDLLREKVAHCRTRSAIRLRERPRLPASVRELLSLRYARFSLGWKSFAQDLLL
jgi:glycosyltransferase involved in cell wall biosynthesis